MIGPVLVGGGGGGAAKLVKSVAYDAGAGDLLVTYSDDTTEHRPLPAGVETPSALQDVSYDAQTDRLVVTLTSGRTYRAPVPAAAIPPPRNVVGAQRLNPATVRVGTSDGATTDVQMVGGGAWLLTDPGVRLDAPRLRLDGTIAP